MQSQNTAARGFVERSIFGDKPLVVVLWKILARIILWVGYSHEAPVPQSFSEYVAVVCLTGTGYLGA
jgi:hypothetical protein